MRARALRRPSLEQRRRTTLFVMDAQCFESSQTSRQYELVVLEGSIERASVVRQRDCDLDVAAQLTNNAQCRSRKTSCKMLSYSTTSRTEQRKVAMTGSMQ